MALDAQVLKVLKSVDRDSLVRLAIELTDIQSPTGSETPVAEYLRDRFESMGLQVRMQEISPGRFNCIGTLEGTGGGPTLMFNGHMDTSYTGRETELGEAYKAKSHIKDGKWIFGMGVYNMKSALVAYVGVVEAIQRAKVKVAGDILIAAVCGEIEKGPIDRYQGEEYAGYGAGSKYAITHGVLADYCILGEPTGLDIHLGHMGALWLKITAYGTMAHTQYADTAINSIEKMIKVEQAFLEWIPGYRKRNEFEGLMPQVNIAATEGGWPYRAARTPAECHLYVDVRFNPNQKAMDVVREVKNLLRKIQKDDSDFRFHIEPYISTPGYALGRDDSMVKLMQKSHKRVFGKPPHITFKGGCNDGTHLVRYHIPTVQYGPAGQVMGKGKFGWSPNLGEHQHIEDLVNCTKVYAAAALDLCGVTAPEAKGSKGGRKSSRPKRAAR